MLSVCYIQLIVQQVGNVQDIEDTSSYSIFTCIMLHHTVELELLAIITIRFYYKINPVLCTVVVYCFDERVT